MKLQHVLNENLFKTISDEYFRIRSLPLFACDPRGELVYGLNVSPKNISEMILSHTIHEPLRWGEATIYDDPEAGLLFGIPIMFNSIVVGGIITSLSYEEFFPESAEEPVFDLQEACADLRLLAEKYNLTNASQLAERRREYRNEQKKAEAIHEIKEAWHSRDVLEQYLQDEPALLSAVQRGDRPGAIDILNGILIKIYFAGNKMDMIKSLIMELIVSMCRTAVSAGGASSDLLGRNFSVLAELGQINNEEKLSAWVVQTFDRIMDIIQRGENRKSSLTKGIDYIRDNYTDPITREDAAAAAGMSAGRFSTKFKAKTGEGFNEYRNRLRIDLACKLIRKSELTMGEIATQVGFPDQSYFTKIFKKHADLTPKEYQQQIEKKSGS